MRTGWNSAGTAHEARIAWARSPSARTAVVRRAMSNTLILTGMRQRVTSVVGSMSRRIRSKRLPASRPAPGAGSQNSRRSRRWRRSASASGGRPAAHAPPPRALADEPATTRGSRPRRTSDDSMPVCAKNEKNPLDTASANGRSESQSPSESAMEHAARDDLAVLALERLGDRIVGLALDVAHVLHEHAPRVGGARCRLVAHRRQAIEAVLPPRAHRRLAAQQAARLGVARADLRRCVGGVVGVEREQRVEIAAREAIEPGERDRPQVLALGPGRAVEARGTRDVADVESIFAVVVAAALLLGFAMHRQVAPRGELVRTCPLDEGEALAIVRDEVLGRDTARHRARALVHI